MESDFDGLLTKRDLMEKCLLEGRITDRNKAVMIGDSIGDLNGAESLGIDFIGVTYGFGFQGHPTEKNLNLSDGQTNRMKFLKFWRKDEINRAFNPAATAAFRKETEL